MTRNPDLEGPHGRAWAARLPQEGVSPDHAASLAVWLVNAPGAHPWWSWCVVGVIHLRDIVGVPPANKRYPEAEYEFMIYAIDPTRCPNPEPDDPNGYPHLVPLDVVEQFHGISDELVVQLCNGAVRSIVRGQMSPDQDYRSAWKKMIASTVEHLAANVTLV